MPDRNWIMQWIIKPLVFVVCLIPLIWLIYDGFADKLSPNPIEDITHRTGDWTLRFLLITLALTPLRYISGRTEFIKLRRMVGLYTFFYVCLHFTTYLWLDQGFDLDEIIVDVVKRPYVTVGFTGFILLIPLAMTSTNAMMKRLGRNWKKLHQLVYVIGAFGVLHYLWLVKADVREPIIYAVILLILLGYREWIRRRTSNI